MLGENEPPVMFACCFPVEDAVWCRAHGHLQADSGPSQGLLRKLSTCCSLHLVPPVPPVPQVVYNFWSLISSPKGSDQYIVFNKVGAMQARCKLGRRVSCYAMQGWEG